MKSVRNGPNQDPRQRDKEDILGFLEALPSLAGSIQELLTIDLSTDLAFDRVLDVVQGEPGLAARLISFSNSASVAPERPIVSLEEALGRMGTAKVVELLTSSALLEAFGTSRISDSAIWVHSLQTATIGRELASLAGQQTKPQLAYIAGLLHDIGRLVIAMVAPEEARQVDEEGWSTPLALVLRERYRFGLDHARVGGKYAERIGLPEVLCSLIHHHHEYHFPERIHEPGFDLDLLRVVQMADFTSIVVMTDPGFPGLSVEERCEVLSQRCVHPAWDAPPVGIEVLAGRLPHWIRNADETRNQLVN